MKKNDNKKFQIHYDIWHEYQLIEKWEGKQKKQIFWKIIVIQMKV